MAVIRLQDKTPSVYTEDSRDFQLLCRLYDCVVNGVKFDTDSIRNITNSHLCRNNVLELLKTKVGFFTNESFDDTAIRYVLESFPDLIKNKGSLKAIEEAVNVFLKINEIGSPITVLYYNTTTQVEGTTVPDHTIIIGLEMTAKKLNILKEILKYILPTGFTVFFYFFNSISNAADPEKFAQKMNAKLLFSTYNINSALRSNTYPEYAVNQIGSAVDTVNLISPRDQMTTNYLGMFDTVSALPTGVTGNIALVKVSSDPLKYREYYKTATEWIPIYFRGVYTQLVKPWTSGQIYFEGDLTQYDGHIYRCIQYTASVQPPEPTYWELTTLTPFVDNTIITLVENQIYYLYLNRVWNRVRFLGDFIDTQSVPSPKNYDIIRSTSDDKYYVYLYGTWDVINARDPFDYESLEDVPAAASGDLVRITGRHSYIRLNTAWSLNTIPVYIFDEYSLT